MRIYGVDFTSRPSRSKPLTIAQCRLEDDRLTVEQLLGASSFAAFEEGLASSGPWVAGMDFPFSQPRRLVEDLGWPAESWEAFVDRVARLSRDEWTQTLDMYRAARPSGDKEHKRRTDRRAFALSPMKCYGTPVAWMFYEGAPRLRHTGLNVPVLRPTGDDRTVVEAYPGLVVRNLVGPRKSYKAETKRKQTGHRRKVRREIVTALQGEPARRQYGLEVGMSGPCASRLVEDARGDHLDAVLCALQAAWAWRAGGEEGSWGIPAGCDALEGWIVDPTTARAAAKGDDRRR